MKKAAILSCFLFFFFSITLAQTRFNIREDLGFEGCIFNGVVEIDSTFMVVGPGVLATDSSIIDLMFTATFDEWGNYNSSLNFIRPESFYLPFSVVGFEDAISNDGFLTAGQTFDTQDQNFKAFLANFNEEGDTNSVFLFQSPYLEEYGEDFIAPLSISPSTNPDGSFFVSSNIFKSDQNTATDAWIQRMSPSGETMWSYIYATEANPDQCRAMLPTENGGVIVGIWQFGPDEILTKVIELDSVGNEINQVTLDFQGGSINDFFINNNKEIIIVSRDAAEGIPGGDLRLIQKFDSLGMVLWQEFFGEPDISGFTQEFSVLVQTEEDDFIAGGVEYEYVAIPTDTSGAVNKNANLVKFTDDGQILWERSYSFINSPNDDHTLNDLKVTSDGGFIFCGESTDHDEDLEFTEGPRQQGWLVKVDEYGCLVEGCELWDGINIIEQDSDIQYFKAGPIAAGQFLNIYQSVTAHLSTLESRNLGVGYYQLINSTGQVVEEFPAMSKGTTMMLDISKYASGSYQLVLRKGNEVLQSEKIIIN